MTRRTLTIHRYGEPPRVIPMGDDRAARDAERQSWRVYGVLAAIFFAFGAAVAVAQHLDPDPAPPSVLQINCHRVHGARVCEGP